MLNIEIDCFFDQIKVKIKINNTPILLKHIFESGLNNIRQLSYSLEDVFKYHRCVIYFDLNFYLIKNMTMLSYVVKPTLEYAMTKCFDEKPSMICCIRLPKVYLSNIDVLSPFI